MRNFGILGFAAVLCIIVTAAPGLSAPLATQGASRPGESCKPLLVNWSSVIQQCFLPSQISGAERLFPVSPIDPVAAVQRSLRLPLRQVIILRFVPHDRDIRFSDLLTNTPVIGIHYIFGNIPGNADMLPMPTPPKPRFVIVNEGLWRGGEEQGLRVDRAVGRVSNRPGKVYGPWELDAALPNRHLSVSVETNVDEQTLRQLGREITGEGRR